MSSSQNIRPVIIGVGQCVHKPEGLGQVKQPLDLVEIAVKRAEEDSGVLGLTPKIDSLCLANMLSGSYKDPCGELTQRLGAKPKSTAYTWVGATAPQWFVNRTAENIASGQARLVLICGGEAFYSKKLENKAKGGGSWDWSFPEKESWMVGDFRDPVNYLEQKYGLVLPLHLYPLMENALRFHEGLTLEEQRQELGEFLSGCSAIAAQNPYAWFRTPKTAAEITDATGPNRMVSFPYTKSMCSIMEVDQAGADLIHIDVMDGHFVPNLTIGPGVVKALRPHTRLLFDVHLMIDNPECFIDAFAEAGSDIITVHAEATVHLHRLIQRIKEHELKAGVSINPATPVSVLENILEDVDLVLVMTVNPGFGGQQLIPGAVTKVAALRKIIDRRRLPVLLEVDGGINVETIGMADEAGANIFVAGSAIFGTDNYPDIIGRLKGK